MRYLLCMTLCGMIAMAAQGDELNGKKLHLKAGPTKALHVPVSIRCDGDAEGKVLTVVQAETQKAFPATLRNGELVFIPEGAMPNSEHNYVVQAVLKNSTYAPKVEVKKQDGKDAIDVNIEDVLFTTYNYTNDNKKPFLWPLNSEGQVGVTRDWPMKESDNKLAKDHVHHKSFWSAYGDVNGVDCWGEEPNSGYQHSGEVTSGSGDAYGWILAKNEWQDKDHKPIVSEEREYRFYATPENARLFDVRVTFTADHGDVTFKDTKEGGIVAVRMRPELSFANAHITNALGDTGEDKCWGKPAPWCDYSGDLKDKGWRGVTVFDNPKNLRYPTSWHVRNYGLMGANCFGWSEFTKKDYNKPLLAGANGDYTIKNGDKLTFNYRIYVHSGDVEKAAVKDRFADYTTPPTVEWLK